MPGWMEWLMRGNFTHVLAFSKVDNFVQVIDPIHSHTEVGLRMHPMGPAHELHPDFIALDFALNGGTVVKITVHIDACHHSHSITNFFPGCVTLCKGLIGLSEWVFTPYQFYGWLLENGGEEYTPEKQDMILQALCGEKWSPDLKDSVFKLARRTKGNSR